MSLVIRKCKQSLHIQSLISALDSVMPLDSIFKISILWLVSLVEQSGLSLAWPNTQKIGILTTRLVYRSINGKDIVNSERRGSSVVSMSSLYASGPKTNLLRSSHTFVETFLLLPRKLFFFFR